MSINIMFFFHGFFANKYIYSSWFVRIRLYMLVLNVAHKVVSTLDIISVIFAQSGKPIISRAVFAFDRNSPHKRI